MPCLLPVEILLSSGDSILKADDLTVKGQKRFRDNTLREYTAARNAASSLPLKQMPRSSKTTRRRPTGEEEHMKAVKAAHRRLRAARYQQHTAPGPLQ